MAQFARPTADTHRGSWVDDAAGTSNIYTAIDETVADDDDFVISDASPAASPYVVKLGTISDPGTNLEHIVRYRYRKSQAGAEGINLLVELRENYTNESSRGTLVADWLHTDIAATTTDGAQTLTTGEAGTITDYSLLYLRFVATAT